MKRFITRICQDYEPLPQIGLSVCLIGLGVPVFVYIVKHIVGMFVWWWSWWLK